MSHSRKLITRRLFAGFLSCSFALGSVVATAEAPAKQEAEASATLFNAMEEGKVDVKFIPLGPEKANLIVRNKTDKPLTVKLPEKFAGVPINRQFGGMGGGMGGMGGGMGGMGGGMGGMGGGGMGMQGGMFRIAPKREFKRALTTVCLEHGRPDPNPKMAYTIIPLDKVTKDGRVHALCEALGSGQIAQNTAQAAAWHLTDDLSWQKLASMNKAESKYTGNIRWFSPLELRAAQAVVSEVTRMANAASEGSQSESESESNYTQTTATSLSSKK